MKVLASNTYIPSQVFFQFLTFYIFDNNCGMNGELAALTADGRKHKLDQVVRLAAGHLAGAIAEERLQETI